MPTDERPPGIEVELDAEGILLPRDYSIASGADPAYPVTVADQLAPDSVAARAGRENPDVIPADRSVDEEEEPEVRLVDSASADPELETVVVEPPGALPAEGAAVHLRDEHSL